MTDEERRAMESEIEQVLNKLSQGGCISNGSCSLWVQSYGDLQKQYKEKFGEIYRPMCTEKKRN
jgi:hypothetical protein